MVDENYEEVAMRFLTDMHNGDRELIEGWRRNADRRWLLTLQLCKSYDDALWDLRASLDSQS